MIEEEIELGDDYILKIHEGEPFKQDQEQIKQFFKFLDHEHPTAYQLFYPRDADKLPQGHKFIDNAKQAVKHCKSNRLQGLNCFGINQRPDKGTKSDEIQHLDVILFDVDVPREKRPEYGVASKKQIKEAYRTVENLQEKMQELGFSMDYLDFSGNGFHPGFKVDVDIEDAEDYKETEVYRKLEKLEEIGNQVSTENVEIDAITKDFARRVKIPGTWNVKSYKDEDGEWQRVPEEKWRRAELLHKEEEACEEQNTEAFQQLELQEEEENGSEKPSMDVETPENERIKWVKENDFKFNKLLHDETQELENSYDSRSEKEMALCILAESFGFDKDKILSKSRLTKWDEDGEAYQEHTADKAEDLASNYFDWSKWEERSKEGRKKLLQNFKDQLNPEKKVRETNLPNEDVEKAEEHEPEFNNVLPENHFISQYQETEEEVTDAYPEYHFGAALSLLSLTTQRNAKAAITPKPKYVNTWIQLVGESTVSRKSTVVGNAETLLELSDLSHLLHATEFSREQFFTMMSRDPKNAYWNDDYGDFMAMMKKSYQSGMGQFLCKMYDCPSYQKKELRNESFEIEDAFLPQFTAIQPETLAQKSQAEEIASGLYPRFLYIYATREKERKDIGNIGSETFDKRQRLSNWIRELYKFFTGREKAVDFRFSENAINQHSEWAEKAEEYIYNADESSDLAKFFGRYQVYAFKLAVLIAVGSNEFKRKVMDENDTSHTSHDSHTKHTSHDSQDDDNRERGVNYVNRVKRDDDSPTSVTVTEYPMKIALHYINKLFLPNALRVQRLINSYNDENTVDKVWNDLVDIGGEATRSRLLRKTHLTADKFDDAVNTLRQAKRLKVEVEEKERESGGTVEETTYIALDPNESLDLPGVNVPEFDNPIEKQVDLNPDLAVSGNSGKNPGRKKGSPPPKDDDAKAIYNSYKDQDWFAPEDAYHVTSGTKLGSVYEILNTNLVFKKHPNENKYRVKNSN